MAEMIPPPTLITTLITLATLLLALLSKKAMSNTRKPPLRLPPGPAAMPVVGNLHQVLLKKPAVFRWIHHLMEEMRTDVLCLRLGAVHVVTVSCPEMAREVLRWNDTAFASRPASFAAATLSLGYKNTIMSPYGHQWRKMRRVLASEVFCPSIEGRLHRGRAEEADHLVRHVHSQCSGCTVDVRHVTRHFCGNVIRKLVFGRRYFSGHGNEAAHLDALFTGLDCLGSFSISNYFPALVGFDLDGEERVVRGVMRTLMRLHDPIVEERVKEWRALTKRGEKEKKKRDVADFLDVLVSLEGAGGQPMLTVEEIKAATIELSLATVDNPSNAVEWALAEMVNKPAVMQRAVDELDAVVGKDRLVEEADTGRLKYLKACIREAFRLHPYHPFTPPHVAIADATIAGYTVPKGSHVLISRVGLGRNPKVWDDQLEFRPERHLSDGCGGVTLAEPELRFLSFSAGRRGCPGVSLGTSITMMLFARLLQGFAWSKPDGVDRIELRESATSLALCKPLVLQAKPRLLPHVYEGN